MRKLNNLIENQIFSFIIFFFKWRLDVHVYTHCIYISRIITLSITFVFNYVLAVICFCIHDCYINLALTLLWHAVILFCGFCNCLSEKFKYIAGVCWECFGKKWIFNGFSLWLFWWLIENLKHAKFYKEKNHEKKKLFLSTENFVNFVHVRLVSIRAVKFESKKGTWTCLFRIFDLHKIFMAYKWQTWKILLHLYAT